VTTLGSQLRVVSSEQIEREIAIDLIGCDRADSVALDCARARTILWALSRANPPHILSVMNMLLDRAIPLAGSSDEPAERRRIRGLLDELVEIGDVIELPGGRWHPAAVREVDLGKLDDHRLLIGGVPTTALPADLRAEIDHDGPFRRVRGDRLRRALALPTEQLDSWAGVPIANLTDWAERILSSKLSPYTEAQDGNVMRIYAPHNAWRGSQQTKRWQDRFESATGRFLAEKSHFGTTEYRVIDVRSGRVEQSGAILLPGEARRLMYALDLRAANPVDVIYERTDGLLSLTLWSEIPRSERRLFGALGTLVAPRERYYPRRWRFALSRDAIVMKHIQALGVRLVATGQGRAGH